MWLLLQNNPKHYGDGTVCEVWINEDKGLIKSKAFEITFPKELTLIMKIFKILPYRIYFYLLSKLTKIQKH